MKRLVLSLFLVSALSGLGVPSASAAASTHTTVTNVNTLAGASALRQAALEPMQGAVHAMPGVGLTAPVAASPGANLFYNGGNSGSGDAHNGIGVETAPAVYLVFWGSQWNNNDPSGEATILQDFLNGVGGSPWLNSVTQYCQNVPSGTVSCGGIGGAQFAGNPSGILKGVWYDNASKSPKTPAGPQIGHEAVVAARHFGNATPASNASAQYVIAVAHGVPEPDLGGLCAWHSWNRSDTTGPVAYTNLPYITDAGGFCGANFIGLGPTAGITIVEGHELAETITDPFTITGWLDSSGFENADKCVWIGSGSAAVQNVTFSNGKTFPVQSLWSNASNNGDGGCVISYP